MCKNLNLYYIFFCIVNPKDLIIPVFLDNVDLDSYIYCFYRSVPTCQSRLDPA